MGTLALRIPLVGTYEVSRRFMFWTLRLLSLLVFLVAWQLYGSQPLQFAVTPPTEVLPDLVEGITSGEFTSAAVGSSSLARAQPGSRYRWAILIVGTVAVGTYSLVRLKMPALASELRDEFGLGLAAVGLLMGASSSARSSPRMPGTGLPINGASGSS